MNSTVYRIGFKFLQMVVFEEFVEIIPLLVILFVG